MNYHSESPPTGAVHDIGSFVGVSLAILARARRRPLGMTSCDVLQLLMGPKSRCFVLNRKLQCTGVR